MLALLSSQAEAASVCEEVVESLPPEPVYPQPLSRQLTALRTRQAAPFFANSFVVINFAVMILSVLAGMNTRGRKRRMHHQEGFFNTQVLPVASRFFRPLSLNAIQKEFNAKAPRGKYAKSTRRHPNKADCRFCHPDGDAQKPQQ
jgi:hypothetical protein